MYPRGRNPVPRHERLRLKKLAQRERELERREKESAEMASQSRRSPPSRQERYRRRGSPSYEDDSDGVWRVQSSMSPVARAPQ